MDKQEERDLDVVPGPAHPCAPASFPSCPGPCGGDKDILSSQCFPFPPHECDVSRGGRVGDFLPAMFHWVSAMELEGQAAISCGEGWGWGDGCVRAVDDEAGLLKVPS